MTKITKIRFLVTLLTIFFVGTLGTILYYYARGYRFNSRQRSITPSGLLVLKSVPDGAEVYIDGQLKNATNINISLPPKGYDIALKKDGFKEWNKRLTIEKENVTEATAYLFRLAPSLSPITFTGVVNPTPSSDSTKIAYIVPPDITQKAEIEETGGLWILETVNLPLGFSQSPRRVTDGNLVNAEIIWSPDAKEIIIQTTQGTYLLPTNEFTPQSQRTNITSTYTNTIKLWDKKRNEKTTSLINKLPEELRSILSRKASSVQFSPDEDMVLYTASGSATLNNNLIEPVPGASTQQQERYIKSYHTYIYDIKEDRNFLIDYDISNPPTITGGKSNNANRRITWFPTSRHLIVAQENKISIIDYDATNRQEIYSGSYVAPDAFPALASDRLIILTNLGANTNLPNLYSLSIR